MALRAGGQLEQVRALVRRPAARLAGYPVSLRTRLGTDSPTDSRLTHAPGAGGCLGERGRRRAHGRKRRRPRSGRCRAGRSTSAFPDATHGTRHRRCSPAHCGRRLRSSRADVHCARTNAVFAGLQSYIRAELLVLRDQMCVRELSCRLPLRAQDTGAGSLALRRKPTARPCE